MEELLGHLFAAAIQFSGLPALAERPPIEALPYRRMLVEACADLREDAPTILAGEPPCAEGAGTPSCAPATVASSRHYEQCMAQSGLVAAYLIEQGRIVYRDDLDLANDIDNSFIVHEYVHALQHRAQGADAFADCAAVVAAERQAYAVQQKYLKSRGQMLRVGERLRAVTCAGIR